MLPNVGTWEMIIIFLVIFMVFGANKMPDIARGLGKGLREFKKEMSGIASQIDEVKSDLTLDDTNDDKPRSPAPPLNMEEPPEGKKTDEGAGKDNVTP
jgi:sec-independent protein translocase protein TatA